MAKFMEGWKFSNCLGGTIQRTTDECSDEHPSGLSDVTCVEVKQMDQSIRENRKRISIDDTESDMNISHSASIE